MLTSKFSVHAGFKLCLIFPSFFLEIYIFLQFVLILSNWRCVSRNLLLSLRKSKNDMILSFQKESIGELFLLQTLLEDTICEASLSTITKRIFFVIFCKCFFYIYGMHWVRSIWKNSFSFSHFLFSLTWYQSKEFELFPCLQFIPMPTLCFPLPFFTLSLSLSLALIFLIFILVLHCLLVLVVFC